MKTAIVLLCCAVFAVFEVSTVELPCLGKLPAPIGKAFEDCKAPIPARSKRKAKPATLAPVPKSYLSKKEHDAGRCICQKLKLIDDNGINAISVRKLLDNNYPLGPKQKNYWTYIKNCASEAMDTRRSKEESTNYFIACVEEKYRKVCAK